MKPVIFEIGPFSLQWYGVFIWVELFRPDAWTLGTLAAAQWISLGSITIGIVLLTWRHWAFGPAKS